MRQPMVRPWLVDTFLQATVRLGEELTRKQRVQLIAFHTYRTPSQGEPTLVHGQISDTRHWIPTVFSADCVRHFEDEQERSLTSVAGGVVILQQYKFQARPESTGNAESGYGCHLWVDRIAYMGLDGSTVIGNPALFIDNPEARAKTITLARAPMADQTGAHMSGALTKKVYPTDDAQSVKPSSPWHAPASRPAAQNDNSLTTPSVTELLPTEDQLALLDEVPESVSEPSLRAVDHYAAEFRQTINTLPNYYTDILDSLTSHMEALTKIPGTSASRDTMPLPTMVSQVGDSGAESEHLDDIPCGQQVRDTHYDLTSQDDSAGFSFQTYAASFQSTQLSTSQDSMVDDATASATNGPTDPFPPDNTGYNHDPDHEDDMPCSPDLFRSSEPNLTADGSRHLVNSTTSPCLQTYASSLSNDGWGRSSSPDTTSSQASVVNVSFQTLVRLQRALSPTCDLASQSIGSSRAPSPARQPFPLQVGAGLPPRAHGKPPHHNTPEDSVEVSEAVSSEDISVVGYQTDDTVEVSTDDETFNRGLRLATSTLFSDPNRAPTVSTLAPAPPKDHRLGTPQRPGRTGVTVRLRRKPLRRVAVLSRENSNDDDIDVPSQQLPKRRKQRAARIIPTTVRPTRKRRGVPAKPVITVTTSPINPPLSAPPPDPAPSVANSSFSTLRRLHQSRSRAIHSLATRSLDDTLAEPTHGPLGQPNPVSPRKRRRLTPPSDFEPQQALGLQDSSPELLAPHLPRPDVSVDFNSWDF
ncbi:hypothetical protein IWQ60_006529 [Tieghemiomyces parasiticus]|uniref:Telomere replication protein EST3 n=1 Tax=Tieghemiomyces parasiticus TaxID=78921 RepID=A0A9W8DX85_9FUNG|nr:hypothetical protein IWQ60_006529 [Tieghemiomyces parasiticus]